MISLVVLFIGMEFLLKANDTSARSSARSDAGPKEKPLKRVSGLELHGLAQLPILFLWRIRAECDFHLLMSLVFNRVISAVRSSSLFAYDNGEVV